MAESEAGAEKISEDQVRVILVQTLEQIYLHSRANTEFIMSLNAKLAGVEAHSQATVAAVDEAANEALLDKQVSSQKDLINHLIEKSRQYVVVIMAGFFTASFATLGAVVPRLNDNELRLSALLLTLSLGVFVMWEVVNAIYIGVHTIKGDLGVVKTMPRALRIGWPIAMFLSLATGLPALCLSAYAYLRGLQVVDWGAINF